MVNDTQDNVLFCRFCGHLNRGTEAGDENIASARCAGCGAFSGLETVAESEAQQRSRRIRLYFLRSRLIRVAIVVLPLLALTIWVLWQYTGLPPDPSDPSTRIGDTGVSTAVDDWPQAGRGVTNLASASALDLPPGTAPKPAWSYVTGAPIVAPPAVLGDRVYLTDEAGTVTALDRDTGAVVWRYESRLPAGVTPAVADGLVFVVFRPGLVSALEADTGEVVWSRRLGGASLPSPTIADGRLYVAESDKNRLIALDAANGKTLWEYRLGDWVIAPPVVIDDKVIATANDADVHVIDADTGRQRMIYDAGRSRWVRGGPIATDDLLHFSSFGGRVWGIDYQGHRYPLERQILYFRTLMWVWGFVKQGPVQQGHVWSSWSVDDQPYQPALSGTTLVIADAVGPVTALDSANGSVLWEVDVGADITAPATTAGLVALVGDELGRVTALTIADGSTEWTTTLDSSITASPIAAGGLILVPTAANGGTLFALSHDKN
jgi:outer membrane protein assembly factor BamB